MGLDTVDFAAHCTIHATKIGFKNSTFYLESVVLESRYLPIVCRSERRISDLFSIHRSSSHTLLAAGKDSG